MKNKKIFIAAEIFPPIIGGPATYTVKLANALNKQNFKVRILCYGKPDKTVLDLGIKINYVNNFWPLPIKYFLYFKKLFWFSFNYSTIYAMGPVASGWPAKCVKKITGKKLIVKVVGDYAWEQAMGAGKTKVLIDEFQAQKFSEKIGLLKKIESKVCQSADTIITPSQYLKKIVSGWGVNSEKIKVVYNSFSFCHFDQSGANVTQWNEHNAVEKSLKQKNFIVSVGRLVKWKGFEILIEVVKDFKDFKLMICGDGPEKEKLEKLIFKLNLQNRVEIKKCNHDEVLKNLSQAKMFVLNTSYEGLSHAILEAMGVGVPIITTNVGGNPELIQNNENGILVEYNNYAQLKDAILKLHEHKELQEKFIVNSKKVLQKFTFEKMINDTIQVLE